MLSVQATLRPRIKICCISTADEAMLAIQCGASAVGLVSAMPSGPGVISEEQIANIAARVPPPIGSFLLTSVQDTEAIIAQQRRCGTNTIQIVDRLVRGSYPSWNFDCSGGSCDGSGIGGRGGWSRAVR